MRRKIAKRWRKKSLRMGAIILSEHPVFSKKDLRTMGLKSSDNGFAIKMLYDGQQYMIAANTELEAYKLMTWVIMDEIERM